MQTIQIADGCSQVTSGATPSRKKPEYFIGDIPWLKTKELNDALIGGTEEHISESALAETSCKLIPAGAVVIAMYGATVGKLGILGTPMTTNQACCAMVADEVSLHSQYLFYWLLQNRQSIINLSNGAAQQNLSVRTIKNIALKIPTLEKQIRTADALKSLDDKIAANQLAIHKIQELLHAQWHAITNTGVSSTEPISSIADVNPRTSKPQSDECSFLEMKDLPEYGLIVNRWGKRETKGGTKFRNGDVLLARITPCFENGKMAIVDFLEDDEVGMGSTEYIVFRPKEDIPAAAIHAIISSPEFRSFGYKALTGTSGRQRIAADDLKEIAVPWPPESALTEYRQLADVLLKKATALRNENQVLARTRDELLPLLMSGRITVGEAEDAADEATSES
ncbi:restriction endonuclease subunit S [Corynebacterium tuberculostearicum]